MAKRKYRQYIPGRTPGVHSIITAVRDTDLTEVDGKTRLKPGESITFDFDLMAGVRSYTQWKSLARQISGGACKLEVRRNRQCELEPDLALKPQPSVHAIPPQETTAELTREQEVIAAAKAKDSSIIAKTIDPQDGQHDPVFKIEAGESGPGPAEAPAEAGAAPPVTIADAKQAMDELPGPEIVTKPSIMYSAEPPAPMPKLVLDESGSAPEVTAPEVTLSQAPAPAPAPYDPSQAPPTDYSQVKRTRSKKAK
jgi:hypothetical protein